ncbi:MAG: hypothetical protein WED04_02005 [Promethearchaeati archaeon SRVP18_Atabeyarchaeia-1]
MTEQVQEEPRFRGSRKASILAWIMIAVSMIIISLSRLIVTQYSFETVMMVIIIAFVVLLAGFVILIKYGRRRIYETREPKYPLKILVAGMGLIILGLAMVLVVITLIPFEERTFPFIFSIGLMFAGLIIAAIASIIAQMRTARSRFAVPVRIMESFRQIEPDKSFETKNLSVLKKGDVYILLPKLFNCVYFVKSLRQTPIQEKKLKLPMKILRKRYFTDEIGGLPLAKWKGECKIPVDSIKRSDSVVEEKYAKIWGVVLLVPRYDVPHRKLLKAQDLADRFDKSVIMKIMEQLSKEDAD